MRGTAKGAKKEMTYEWEFLPKLLEIIKFLERYNDFPDIKEARVQLIYVVKMIVDFAQEKKK